MNRRQIEAARKVDAEFPGLAIVRSRSGEQTILTPKMRDVSRTSGRFMIVTTTTTPTEIQRELQRLCRELAG